MLRRLLLIAAVVVAPLLALADPGSRLELLDGFPAPLLDFDFANGVYRQDAVGYSTTASDFITTSRASTGYADDTSGTWTSFSNNVARITNKGLLVEEARTNSIRNNSMQGAGGSTQPTNWSRTGAGATGLSFAYTTVTENGIDCVDIAVSGTPASTGNVNMIFEAAVTGVIGSWTNSAFLSLRTGSLPGGSGLAILETSVGTSGPTITYTSTLTRSSVTRTTTTTNTLQPYVFFGVTSGVPVSFTMRIGWPQFELGASVTSPIRTTSATVTRAADVVAVSSVPSFGTAYSLLVKANPLAPITYPTNQIMLQVDDGTANERLRLRRVATTGSAQGVTTTGGTDVVMSTSGWAVNTSRKIAVAQAIDDEATAFNGAAVVAAAVALPALPTAIRVGSDQAGVSQSNSYIERIEIWPNTRLNNPSLSRASQ